MPFRSARRRAALLAASLLVLGACGDGPTSPKSTVRVAVAVSSIEGPRFSSNQSGDPVVSCRVNLRAVATGEGSATWSGARLRFYIGPNHQSLVDSASFSGEEIGQSWSQDGHIGAGQTQNTYWDMTAAVPFYVTLDYRYRAPNRGEDTTSASFWCGTPGSLSAPAPVITALSVTPPTGELAAGAPITVTYTVSAPAGLWRTDVVVSGPCDVEQVSTFGESLAPSVTRTVSIPIAGTCKLGVPITVTVYALDGLVQSGERTLATQVVLADHDPPDLLVSGRYGPTYGLIESIKGDYFGGQSIVASLGANDNHALSALIWEVLPSGIRDSVLVNGPSASYTVTVKAPFDYDGPLQLRFFARDAQGNVSPVQSTLADSIRVHPSRNGVETVTPLSMTATALLVDPRRNVVYIADEYNSRIVTFSLASKQVVNTVTLPGKPHDIDLSRSGDSLVVTMIGQRSLGIVDLQAATPVVSLLPLPWLPAGDSYASTVRVGSNGHAFVVVRSVLENRLTMYELELGSGTVRAMPAVQSGGGLSNGALARSGDASVIAVDASWGCVRRYDVATDVMSACAVYRAYGARPAVDQTGSHVAMGIDIYDASMQLLPKVRGDLATPSTPVVFGTDGSTMYISIGDGSLVKVRSSDSAPIERTTMAVAPQLLAITPDGQTLIGITGSQVSVLELQPVAGSR